MIFYGGTWLSPKFYHVTEIYNTSIVFVICTILFLNNVRWWDKLKKRDFDLYLLLAILILAVVNLFLIGSHKGCILILADFLLVWYMSSEVRFTGLQMKVLSYFFFGVFFVWFCYDLAFRYNSNTGATVTVFSLFCAMVFLVQITERKEIYGLFLVMAILRTTNLVLWHLARGAFLALFLFLFFYYVIPKKWWENRKLYTFLSFFVCLGSLLFVFSYVALAQTGMNFQMPFFYKSLFSGREKIWMEVWNMWKQHMFTGIGSGYKLESFFEYNIHNAMYDILAVHGLPVFIGSVILIIRRLLAGGKSLIKNRYGRLAGSALFAIFLESFIDMDLMWANYSPVLIFLLAIIFAEREIVDEKR